MRCPNGSRASVLGWEPKVELDTGLKKTIAFFDKLLTESGQITVSSKS